MVQICSSCRMFHTEGPCIVSVNRILMFQYSDKAIGQGSSPSVPLVAACDLGPPYRGPDLPIFTGSVFKHLHK